MVTKLRQPRQTAWFSVGFPYRTILLVLCFSWVRTSPVFAQSQTAEESKSMGAEVQLRVSTSSSEFYLGDGIPLDLAFGSMVPKRYQINLARYDRSGRMGYEPKDATRDPLYLYFNSIAGFVRGGLTKFEFLAPSPTVLHLKLNEWVSFDHQGIYRIQVVSHRVRDSTKNSQPCGESVELKSNWIELRIVAPEPSWQQQTLAAIRQALDTGKPLNPNVPDEPKRTALTRLRYLGTEEAARELARRLRGEDNNADFECMFGVDRFSPARCWSRRNGPATRESGLSHHTIVFDHDVDSVVSAQESWPPELRNLTQLQTKVSHRKLKEL